jgi:16S rRNA (cytosine1402-N4)-methyltransferase
MTSVLQNSTPVGGSMMAPEMNHDPVMLHEALAAMKLRRGSIVVDGTVGLGGHSKHILEQIGAEGRLYAFDWDILMLAEARLRLSDDLRVTFINENYRSIRSTMEAAGVSADAILMDLGLNSVHLDDASRGISFRNIGPLDMRMDQSSGEPASALLNRLSPDEIEHILWTYGDERWARAIARKIVERRKDHPLRTTDDLVQAVLGAVPTAARDKRIHPATRTFQAVRIHVNGELDRLDQALEDAALALAEGGHLVVLSYHSGEDRAAKTAFRRLAETDHFEEVNRKPVVPTASEISRNPRSRSAKMRVLRRTDLHGSERVTDDPDHSSRPHSLPSAPRRQTQDEPKYP